MVAQQKTGSTLQERIDEYQRNPTAENASPANVDTAGELVNVLDALLLERAQDELRAALARLNQLQQALGKSQS
jgi:hypothetical protein